MKKVLFVFLAIVIITIIGYVIFYNMSSLTISVNPNDAKITVDQKVVSSGEKLTMKPGAHEIIIEKEKYIPYRKLVNISVGSPKIVEVTLREMPVPQKVTDAQARFATLSLDKNSLYYLSQKTMYAIDNINTTKLNISAISPDFFEDVTNIVWSPNQEMAIVKQNDKTSLYNFSRYDLLHQEITPFNDSGIKDTIWNSDSKNIMYYYEPGTGERTLIKATPTNTDKQVVYNFKDTQIRNPKIDWSVDQNYVTILSAEKVYILNLYLNQMTIISADKKINEVQFTPDGRVIMKSLEGVFITDVLGQSVNQLDINTDLKRITFMDENNLLLAQKDDTNQYQFYLYNIPNSDKIKLEYNSQYSLNPIDNIITTDNKKIYFESNNYIYQMIVDIGEY